MMFAHTGKDHAHKGKRRKMPQLSLRPLHRLSQKTIEPETCPMLPCAERGEEPCSNVSRRLLNHMDKTLLSWSRTRIEDTEYVCTESSVSTLRSFDTSEALFLQRPCGHSTYTRNLKDTDPDLETKILTPGRRCRHSCRHRDADAHTDWMLSGQTRRDTKCSTGTKAEVEQA